MNLTTILAIGWAVTAALGFGGTMYYRDALHTLERDDALAAQRATEKVNVQKAADAAATRALAEQAQQVKADIQEQINASAKAFAKVQSVVVCGTTPAARAFDVSLQPLGKQTPTSPTGPAKP